ncbi:NAC domain-containing protein 90-like [Sesamum indicum]|uniref:NAC domain-containing protein 90-like n=1 Tax=Sesamum indicum TaxID=4182 RepID=A0A6I9T2Y5_SESIN|nr:NAC domain-containing protein 90-like [Sesamum indicum]
MDAPLPGFRFYPTEQELLSFYLHHKIKGTSADIDSVIPVVHIYDYNPWDLPQFAGELCPEDSEQWFFFIPRQEREARGGRPNRLTPEGYWKATGSPGEVYSSQNHRIGQKKTMVFYEGRANHRGRKTDWKMNEYKIFVTDHGASSSSGEKLQVNEEYRLCRIYKRSRSLRAFDRRPLREEAATGHQQAPVHRQEPVSELVAGDHQAAVDHQQHHHTAQAAVINDSSSGDHNTNHENNWDMATENEPLWAWEELNWFYLQ